MVDSRYFVDIMDDVVDSMREYGTITASSEVSGVYTLTYSRSQDFNTNTLKNDYHVTIDDIDYQISNLTETQFTITAETGLDFTDEEWKSLEPYYMYGHMVEVSNRLSLKDRNPLEKFNKYPLVYLLTDFIEDHDSDINIDYSVNPTILIICSTDKNYVAPARYENKFKPILYPLYESLNYWILKNKKILTKTNELIPHQKIDRLYWGVQGVNGNTDLFHNEHNDAIEISYTELPIVKTKQCSVINISS